MRSAEVETKLLHAMLRWATTVRTGKGERLLARNPLEEATQATPAIAGGRMFIRTSEHLHCIGTAQP